MEININVHSKYGSVTIMRDPEPLQEASSESEAVNFATLGDSYDAGRQEREDEFREELENTFNKGWHQAVAAAQAAFISGSMPQFFETYAQRTPGGETSEEKMSPQERDHEAAMYENADDEISYEEVVGRRSNPEFAPAEGPGETAEEAEQADRAILDIHQGIWRIPADELNEKLEGYYKSGWEQARRINQSDIMQAIGDVEDANELFSEVRSVLLGLGFTLVAK